MDQPINSPINSTSPTSPTVRLEPVTESVVVPQPWYRRIFGPVTRTDTVWKLSVVALMIVGVFIGNSMRNPQVTVTKAATGNAKISVYPLDTVLSAEKSFQLWVTIDQPVSDANIVLSFDPRALQLTREVTPSVNPKYGVESTTFTSANKTGVLGFHVKPNPPGSPVSAGTIQLATFYFNKLKGTASTSTSIAVNTAQTSVLNQDLIPFTVTPADATITLSQ